MWMKKRIGTCAHCAPVIASNHDEVLEADIRRGLGRRTRTLFCYFNTCEIKAIFYRQCESKILSKWNGAVEDSEFKFAIKADQAFTHAAGAAPATRQRPTSVETLQFHSSGY
jgi:uncharacterized protein YecE (DUF72 family)